MLPFSVTLAPQSRPAPFINLCVLSALRGNPSPLSPLPSKLVTFQRVTSSLGFPSLSHATPSYPFISINLQALCIATDGYTLDFHCRKNPTLFPVQRSTARNLAARKQRI